MSWPIYHGDGKTRDDWKLPDPPAWRSFRDPAVTRGETYRTAEAATPELALTEEERAELELERRRATIERDMVNAALFLRRPLLVTGRPGIGKSSLAYAVAHELGLGRVLEWRITTRSTLNEGLYSYDALGRLEQANLLRLQAEPPKEPPRIGPYVRLGPLGTALLNGSPKPRVLLVDEIDKSDVDLPNNLLHVFEEGRFEIPELKRLAAVEPTVALLDAYGGTASIHGGEVVCQSFPFVVFTSNGEREFPQAFLRRCLRLTIRPPGKAQLARIVAAHFAEHKGQTGEDLLARARPLIAEFIELRDAERRDLSTDQLLNAVYLVTQQVGRQSHEGLFQAVLRSLSSRDDPDATGQVEG